MHSTREERILWTQPKDKKKKKKKRKNIYLNGSIKCIAMLQALRRNHNKSWPKRQCNNSAVVSLYSDFYCSSWRSFSSFQFGSVSGSFICFALFVLLDVCIAFFPCFFFWNVCRKPTAWLSISFYGNHKYHMREIRERCLCDLCASAQKGRKVRSFGLKALQQCGKWNAHEIQADTECWGGCDVEWKLGKLCCTGGTLLALS